MAKTTHKFEIDVDAKVQPNRMVEYALSYEPQMNRYHLMRTFNGKARPDVRLYFRGADNFESTTVDGYFYRYTPSTKTLQIISVAG